jgi:pimeloyl-[acyl-carrier protein] methyl ester esterase
MILLGWSLGGLIAIRLARRLPQRIHRLVLVGTTPRFVTGPDWPWAVEPPVLQSFGQNLAGDYRRTVRDFLALQVRGDEHALELLRTLKRRVFAHGEPDPGALRQGLELLAKTDLRADLPHIRLPTLVIAGERDRLTPAEAGARLAEAIAGACFMSIPGAAHAPFLSHRRQFLDGLTQFLDDT